EQRDRPGVEWGGKAVEHAREAELDAHADAVRAEIREQPFLGRQGRRRPASLGGVTREPTVRRDTLGQRRSLQYDELALADLDARPGAAHETSPRRRLRDQGALLDAADAEADHEQHRREGDDRRRYNA